MKYTSKGEKASSVLNNAFTNAISKISNTSDIYNMLKQIMIKSVGQIPFNPRSYASFTLTQMCKCKT